MNHFRSVVLHAPFELRNLVHHHVPEPSEAIRNTFRVYQFGQTIGVGGPLCGRCAGHHPQPCVFANKTLERLPTLCLGVLVGTGLVNNNQVETASRNLFLNHTEPVKVDNDELGMSRNDFLTLGRRPIGNVNCAVHCKVEQIVAPRCVHDRHWAHNQNPRYDFAFH